MKKQTTKISLAGALTIYTAEENRIRLTDALRTPNALELDLGAVNECDSAGVQLLCSAHATAAAAGLRFSTSPPPGCVQNACAAIGIDPQTLEPSVI